MIGDFVLVNLKSIVDWILSKFPAYSGLPTGVSDAVSYMSGKFQGLSCILPINDMYTIATYSFWIAVAYLTFKFVRFVFKW